MIAGAQLHVTRLRRPPPIIVAPTRCSSFSAVTTRQGFRLVGGCKQSPECRIPQETSSITFGVLLNQAAYTNAQGLIFEISNYNNNQWYHFEFKCDFSTAVWNIWDELGTPFIPRGWPAVVRRRESSQTTYST